MSGGWEAAMDTKWGRGGGRRLPKDFPQHPGGLIVELDELRREREAMPRVDPQCGHLGCLLRVSEHRPVCRLCGTFVEHHADGVEELEWEGKARLALCRYPEDRTVIDAEAIYRYPQPRSWVGGPVPEGLVAALERYRLTHLEVVA